MYEYIYKYKYIYICMYVCIYMIALDKRLMDQQVTLTGHLRDTRTT